MINDYLLEEKINALKNHAVLIFNKLDEIIDYDDDKSINFLKNFSYNGNKYDLTTNKGTKKYLLAKFKESFPQYNIKERVPKELINKFTQWRSHGESYKNIYIFQNKKGVMEKIYRYCNVEGDNNYYDYSPTGFWFASPAKIIETKERIIVIQEHVLDC